MSKTSNLFKNIGNVEGVFHARTATIKGRNGKDLDWQWQEYTEINKKGLNDPSSPDNVVIHLEPDILKCEAKWALGSISLNKTRGGDGIPAEIFQILKDDAVEVLHSICQQIWKLSSGHRTGKGQFSFQSQRKAMLKTVQTVIQLGSFHMLARLCTKSFKLGFNSMWT